MTESSGQLERVAEIERLLRDRGSWSARRLAERFGVTRRTVQRDLAYLRRRYRDQLVVDGERYRLEVRRPVVLNAVEALATYMAARLLLHHGLADEHYRQALRKLAAAVPELARTQLTARIHAPAPRALQDRGRVFDHVARAWFERRALDCHYASRGGDARPRRLAIHSVEMGRRNHLPYAFAVDILAEHREVRVYRLSRMTNVNVTNVVVDDAEGFDLDAFMGDAFGIVTGAPIRVEVLVPEPLHHNFCDSAGEALRDRAAASDGQAIFTIAATVTPNGDAREVVAWLLSWGADIEVVSPPSIREQVSRELAAAAARYGTPFE
jgi:predicted DNA-binding transcriptional regulator YafY